MLDRDQRAEHYSKSEINRNLRSGELSSRSHGSIEMRMCNISSVLADRELPFVEGYKPREHVGARVAGMIFEALANLDHFGVDTSQPSLDHEVGTMKRPRISLPESIPVEFLERAIERIDRDGFAPHHESVNYALVYDHKRYPPIAVVAFALEEVRGQTVAAGIVRGGKDTKTFRILQEAGFLIEPKYFEATHDQEVLKQRVTEILQNKDLGDSAPNGNETPDKKATKSETYVRETAVIAWVLIAAKKTCELCQEPAPFRKPSGEPYLEVHHVVPLADDGPDVVTNAVALCPNCHAQCHYSEDARHARNLLYQQVGRLKRPFAPLRGEA